jgi:hypothetical protein
MAAAESAGPVRLVRRFLLHRTRPGSSLVCLIDRPTVLAPPAVVLNGGRRADEDVLLPHKSDDAAMSARSSSRQGEAFYAHWHSRDWSNFGGEGGSDEEAVNRSDPLRCLEHDEHRRRDHDDDEEQHSCIHEAECISPPLP